MGNFGQNEYSFCAQGLNLGGYDSGFSNFSKKMGENGEIVRFLWYFMVFRKRTYGELMGGLGTSLIFFFLKSIHCPL